MSTRRNEDHSTAFWIEHVDLAGQLRRPRSSHRLLTRATAFAGLSGGVRHDDLQFGALWLHGMDWHRPAALPWVTVDLTTGELLRTAASIVPRDETAEVRAMLDG